MKTMKIDREKIRELASKGYTDGDIARMIGCCTASVSVIRRDELRILKGRPRKKGETVLFKVSEILKKDPTRSYADIARQLDTNPQYVYMIGNRMGIKRVSLQMNNIKSLQFYKLLNDSPFFLDELTITAPSSCYMTLINADIKVRRFSFGSDTLYYLEHDNEKAFKKLTDRFQNNTRFLAGLNTIRKIFKIKEEDKP